MTTPDAVRLAAQASFGPTEALVATIRTQGAQAWINAQLAANVSRYTSGNGAEVHQFTASGDFCDG
jgi:hypothetical protein